MNIRIISFAGRGEKTASELAGKLETAGTDMHCSVCRCGRDMSLDEWTEEAFREADALCFIGALGIAVRAVSPFIKDKFHDPAVICMDDEGRFVIPVLSGHIGGANALARTISGLTGAVPVITTATDIAGVFAVDDWAARQDLVITDISKIKGISSKLLSGGKVRMESDFPIEGEVPEGIIFNSGKAPEGKIPGSDEDPDITVSLNGSAGTGLVLVPKRVIIGIGTKKGAGSGDIEELFLKVCEAGGFSADAVAGVASIDIKKDEPGLLGFCESIGTKARFYSAEELAMVKGSFSSSEFVFQQTGVDNICERSAVKADGGKLIVKKMKGRGVTMAAALMPVNLKWTAPRKLN